MLKETTVILAKDPDRVHRVNANSFQQNAITTVNGWQYAAFYTDAINGEGPGICHVNVSRRMICASDVPSPSQTWVNLALDDYNQSVDDGHNTISIGVCKGDGTIHLAFDHHCSPLRFRISGLGAAAVSAESWDISLFSLTLNALPGIPQSDLMKEVTYPRFMNIDDDLVLTYRIGQAGLGSDVLYRYSSVTHAYTYIGQHLTGVSNSPYINGIDYRKSRLHISWCYRNFVPFLSSVKPNAHKQQAGPNGPENNSDLCYAYSDDLGCTWKSSNGNILAKTGIDDDSHSERTIKPGASGARIYEIPMGSGILNQEAQTADWEGRFLVLNRENRSGEERWMLYCRDEDGKWAKTEVPAMQCTSLPTETGSRGSICVDRANNVYLILPGNLDSSLSIMKGRMIDGGWTFQTIWTRDGFDGEPLVDAQRLEISNTLSVFTRTNRKADGRRDVVVMDFVLPE